MIQRICDFGVGEHRSCCIKLPRACYSRAPVAHRIDSDYTRNIHALLRRRVEFPFRPFRHFCPVERPAVCYRILGSSRKVYSFIPCESSIAGSAGNRKTRRRSEIQFAGCRFGPLGRTSVLRRNHGANFIGIRPIWISTQISLERRPRVPLKLNSTRCSPIFSNCQRNIRCTRLIPFVFICKPILNTGRPRFIADRIEERKRQLDIAERISQLIGFINNGLHLKHVIRGRQIVHIAVNPRNLRFNSRAIEVASNKPEIVRRRKIDRRSADRYRCLPGIKRLPKGFTATCNGNEVRFTRTRRYAKGVLSTIRVAVILSAMPR